MRRFVAVLTLMFCVFALFSQPVNAANKHRGLVRWSGAHLGRYTAWGGEHLALCAKNGSVLSATEAWHAPQQFAGQFRSHLRRDSNGNAIVNPQTRKLEIDNGSLGFPFRRLVGQFGKTPLYNHRTLAPMGRDYYDNGSTRVALRAARHGAHVGLRTFWYIAW